MKNENGTGSIYKLKGKRRKPWVARITTGYSIEGKQLRKSIGTFETKKEAQKALLEYFDNPLLFSGKTFGEIKNLWWESYCKKISKKTFQTKLSFLRMFEILDDVKITNINLAMLQNIFDKLKVSWGTKNNLRSLLNMIFDYALKYEFIEVNKIHLIDLGAKEKVIERKIFTQKEIDTLWQDVNSKNISYAILILIYTGMRIGELLNLKNNDIDFLNKTIKIKESKTNAGIRTIPISDKIIHIFMEKVNCNEEYFLQGNRKKQENYQSFSLKFEKLLKTLNLNTHTIHDTRHTFATLLNNANANSTSIIKLIGHTDFKTTENVYTHKDIEELRKAVNLLN